jgi:hypothetical protein
LLGWVALSGDILDAPFDPWILSEAHRFSHESVSMRLVPSSASFVTADVSGTLTYPSSMMVLRRRSVMLWVWPVASIGFDRLQSNQLHERGQPTLLGNLPHLAGRPKPETDPPAHERVEC